MNVIVPRAPILSKKRSADRTVEIFADHSTILRGLAQETESLPLSASIALFPRKIPERFIAIEPPPLHFRHISLVRNERGMRRSLPVTRSPGRFSCLLSLQHPSATVDFFETLKRELRHKKKLNVPVSRSRPLSPACYFSRCQKRKEKKVNMG